MQIETIFERQFGEKPALMARAPGRVNLLGEHVDYNAGPVLPIAIDREIQLAAAPDPRGLVSLYAADLEEQEKPFASFYLVDLLARKDIHGQPLPDWALYPAGVAWALQRASLEVSGLKVAFSSNLPIGAGLSSSAALEVGFACLWRAAGGWSLDGLALAQICQQAENEYVGVACGLMDQFASANGVAGHALYFDTRSLECLPLPMIPDTAILIADSSLRRSLVASAYNERKEACQLAVAILKNQLPLINNLRDVTSTEFAAYSPLLPPEIRKRAEHVVKEIARVETARRALERQDGRAFGALMFAGHDSLRDLYEVSLPEMDALVELARQLPGCLGARLTGAGFGGCTVNLVEAVQITAFEDRLASGYYQTTGLNAEIYVCQASQGAEARFL